MKPTWNDLTLGAIDFHLHAGSGRKEEFSLLDVVDFAIATGRRIIGLTDHLGRFLGLSQKPVHHYDPSIEGFRAYAADVCAAREARPDVILLLAPEIAIRDLDSGAAEAVFAVDEVDCFLGEPGGAPEGTRYGDHLVRCIETVARFRDTFGKPGVIVHPLRYAIGKYCGKAGPGPKYPMHPPFAPLESCADPVAHVEKLLDIDLGMLAEALVRHDLPVELNDSDRSRILGMNHESFFERYIRFYRELLASGVRIVPGSDLHSIETPKAVPFVGARVLGVRVTDMVFLRHWLGPVPA
jgi:hypothetical protein